MNYVYFWGSLIFLMSRTVAVFLSASSINEASKQPARAISSVRTEDWSIEAERMFDQVNNEQIALSGMKFFHLTRTLLMGVSSGKIVTLNDINILFFFR